MRQYLTIILTVVLVIIVLVAINAASYVEIERAPDSEYKPDRSTYNAGATGTRALYDYLQESGYKVSRWREKPERLFSADKAFRGTFVVVGNTRVEFEPKEIEDLLKWVARGGRLVIIDRTPDQRLLPASGNWSVATELRNYPQPNVRADNVDEMTAGVALAHAAQPTTLTVGVDSALPSRYASVIKIFATEGRMKDGGPSHRQNEDAVEEDTDFDLSGKRNQIDALGEAPRLSLSSLQETATVETQGSSPAPVVHLIGTDGALLADYKHGAGRIIILSDPFIISNNGLNRADNLRLAINVVAGAGGLIAFDEYHQGRAATENQVLSYFAGTPVLAMIGQLGLVLIIIVWTNGRRFARPLPLPTVDRRSKLEFVASMAELQQRARAYDLAIENIYTRTRRVLARYSGVEPNGSRREIAERVAARSKVKAEELEALMRECEDAMAGEPITARRTLHLIARLREVERTLGLRMRSREIKQAKER